MNLLTPKFANLRASANAKTGHIDSEDVGETIDAASMAGGGHAGRETRLTHQLRVSHALRSFLAHHKVLTREQASLDQPEEMTGELRGLLDKAHTRVPPELTDRSHPLPNYFISSSHNTYLVAHQLYGSSSADAYKIALKAGARCVEIDAWDGDDPDEPKVTHGYTFTSHIPFRVVCETIRDVVDQEAKEALDAQGYRAAPIMLSLENHCNEHGQLRLVAIMKEIFADRLLSKAVRDKGTREQQGTGEHVTLAELGSKIAVIVEYHPEEVKSNEEEASDDEDEEEKQARLEYQERKRKAATIIVPELAELGVYAQSVKPPDNTWFETGLSSPHHPLINVSESGLSTLMPTHNDKIARHNSMHLMRVYPKGTRISSQNLKPVAFWAVGAHICALNWQTFGAPMQLNEALFSGTEGYVLKPQSLRSGAAAPPHPKRKKLILHVAGATDVPSPEGREVDDIKPYLTCSLMHPDDPDDSPAKKKTSAYKQHKLSFLHQGENPPASEPIWNEKLEWEFDDNELVFLRLLVKSDDAFARNPILVVNAVRLLYVQPGWIFIRMLDLKGHETRCSILVKFDIHDV